MKSDIRRIHEYKNRAKYFEFSTFYSFKIGSVQKQHSYFKFHLHGSEEQ